MSVIELRKYPDPCLRKKTRAVREFTGELESAVRRMAEIMYLNRGIGLAAPQVGLDESLIVVDIGEGLNIFVNPEVVELSAKKERMEEGCLSLPCVAVEVSRPVSIKVEAQDSRGAVFQKSYNGLMARVIQHEMDHLKGKMIIDYLNPISRLITDRKLTRKSRICRNADLRL